MRTLLFALQTAALCGTLAFAQESWWGAWPPDRVSGIVEQVHTDLTSGYNSGWKFTGGDRHRLDDAEKELHKFAEHWHDRGRFDKGELDHSIGDIQRVVEKNHMSGPNREALWHDLDQLREMRAAYDRHAIGRW